MDNMVSLLYGIGVGVLGCLVIERIFPLRKGLEARAALKRFAFSSLARLGYVAAVAVWGYQSDFVRGLSAILAFGICFLCLTIHKMIPSMAKSQSLEKRFRVSSGSKVVRG